MPVLTVSSLPNAHPAVIHFPIALLLTALAVEFVALRLTHHGWLDRTASLLWILGAVGSGAAFLTGRAAGDGLGLVSPDVQAALARHANLALWTVAAAGAMALLRLVLLWPRVGTRIHPRVGVAGKLGLGLAVVALVGFTADRGGTLVYRYGAAVTAPGETKPEPPSAPAASEPRRVPLTRVPGGGLRWSPEPGDAASLNDAVTVIAGAGVITAETATGETAAGLALRADGLAFLLLPGEFADVQVEAAFDPTDFVGTVGVLHDFHDEGSYGAFALVGAASRLSVRRGDGFEVLDEGRGTRGQGEVTLAVSSVGSHVKGFLGSETVAHGHTPALPAGRVGLLIDGRGTLRVLELRAEPASNH